MTKIVTITITPQKAGALVRKHGLRLPDTGDYVELPNATTITKGRTGYAGKGFVYYQYRGPLAGLN